MPTHKPHQQRKRRRPGAYAEPAAVHPEHTAEAYRWHCATCPCTTNLRGLLRAECSRCGHQHDPDAPPWREEPTHAE